jgi:hypothetical protein
MKIIRLTFCILLAVTVWTAGCVSTTDPLTGWKPLFGRDYEKVDKAIMNDYQDYIQKLPDEERKSVGPIFLFEDGAGQHAAEFKLGVNGTVWEHVLIYDKDNKRVKTIKYSNGDYRS